MEKSIVTILTPTYNRSNNLWKLYESLCHQELSAFQWIIVDDGSSDDTELTVKKMQDSELFPILYYKKHNGGKHTALNYGLKYVDTPLCMIVDSDDWLTEDAVSVINRYYEAWREQGADTEICGFTYLRKYPSGEINGKLFSCDGLRASYIESRVNARDTKQSDKAEVFFTECLREFPFPEFRGEKFLGEDVVWIRMARKYQMLHYNIPIYVSEYLEDGLTNNRRIHNLHSPKGCTIRAREFMKKDIILSMRVKGTLQYLIYGRTANLSWWKLLRKSPDIFLSCICLAPAVILYYRWRNKYLEK